jgi:hypothetical protein
MEDNPSVIESQEDNAVRNCASCGQPAMEEEHPTLLCRECREKFTRYPIPVWIKAFAGGVGILLLFSLVTLPKNLSMGIHLERGERAEKQHKYLTAERELKKVLEKAPGNVEAKGHLLISSFYNQDYETFADMIKKLQQVNIDDNDLMDRMTGVMNKAAAYVSNDSFENFKNTRPALPQLADSAWEGYFTRNPTDSYAATDYVQLLIDRKEYHRCDSILQSILDRDPEYFPALVSETSLKREEQDLEGALEYSRKLLAINSESAFGEASEVRTLLRQKKDRQALDLALKCYEKNDKSLYILSTLILAYHFNGRNGDRDALIKKARAAATDSSEKVQVQYALDVIAKKEKFRD